MKPKNNWAVSFILTANPQSNPDSVSQSAFLFSAQEVLG
jgi:hypothetical protein